MREIYIPNVFRTTNIRSFENGEKLSNIPYLLGFDLENEQHLKAMMQFNLATILENILLFDRVILDIIDLPVAIDLLYKIDPISTVELIKRDYLSFINSGEIIISIVKDDDDKFYIAYMCNKELYIKSEKDLEEVLFGCFDRKDAISPLLKQIFLNSKSYAGDIDKIGMQIVHMVDAEIKEKKYSKLGIGLNGNYAITPRNKGIFDIICQVVRDETIASIFGINTIYHDDIVREIACMRINSYYSINDDFNKLIKVNNIPDIHKLFLEGNLSIKDILDLKKSRKYKAFKKWFFSIENNVEDDIISSFIASTKKRSKLDNLPMKSIRFAITTGAGAINPIVGAISGIADSFGIDFLKLNSPDLFFDVLTKKIEKNNLYNNKDYYEICIPLYDKLDIDLSKQIKLDKEQEIYDLLIGHAKDIISANNELEALKIFEESQKVLSTCCTIKTFEAYSICIANLSQRSIINCKNFIIGAYNIIQNNTMPNVKETSEELYMFLLIFGLCIDLDNILQENLIKEKMQIINKNNSLDQIIRKLNVALKNLNIDLVNIDSDGKTIINNYIILSTIFQVIPHNIYAQISYIQLASNKLFVSNSFEEKKKYIDEIKRVYNNNSKNLLIQKEYAKCLVNITSIVSTYEEKLIWTNKLCDLYKEHCQNQDLLIYYGEALVNLSTSDPTDNTLNILKELSNKYINNITLKILCSIVWFNKTTNDKPLSEKNAALKELKEIYIHNSSIKEIAINYTSGLVNLQNSYQDEYRIKNTCDEVYTILNIFDNDLQCILIICKSTVNYLRICKDDIEIKKYYLRLLNFHLKYPDDKEIINECVGGILNICGDLTASNESIERLKNILSFSNTITKNKVIIKEYAQLMQVLISRSDTALELKDMCMKHLITIAQEHKDVISTETDSSSVPPITRLTIL